MSDLECTVGVPGESSPLGLKHAVTSNRLGHALAALRELREATFDGTPAGDIVRSALADDAAIRDNVMLTQEPRPASVSPNLVCTVCAEVNALDGEPWAGSGYQPPTVAELGGEKFADYPSERDFL